MNSSAKFRILDLHIVEYVLQRWLDLNLFVQLLYLGRSQFQFAERLSAIVVQREEVGAGSLRRQVSVEHLRNDLERREMRVSAVN